MLTFKHQLQYGYILPKRNKPYLEWVKSLPCSFCTSQADEAHHILVAGFNNCGPRTNDFLTIPLCKYCYAAIHSEPDMLALQWEKVAFTLLQAIHDGVLRE